MENGSTQDLLARYYNDFAKKQKGWESVLADDFQFFGGDMTKTTPITGKEGYVQVINRFSQVFKTMNVKEMIIQEETACVIGHYNYEFPGGKAIDGDVAEIWKVKNGKLASLTIFFDTLTFHNLTPGPK